MKKFLTKAFWKQVLINWKKILTKDFWMNIYVFLKTETRKKEFWIEYITIYISIIIVSFIVQKAILGLSTYLLLFCLSKSIFTTIPNIIAIISCKKLSIINKSRFREAWMYSISSFPYVEISVVAGYEQDLLTIGKAIGLYIGAYFMVGIFNRHYLQAIKKVVIIGASPKKTVQRTTQMVIRKKRNTE